MSPTTVKVKMRLFVNLDNSRLLLLAACAAISSGVAAASDCGYPRFTLEVDYQRADSIVVATVSGCPDSQLPVNDECPDQLYSLNVIEVLKDSVPSRNHGGVIQGIRNMGCGMYIRVGQSYVLFLDENGDPSPGASGNLSGDDSSIISTEQRLQILRQYQDGLIDDLSEPWRFNDSGRSCHINHSFKGGDLSFAFGYVDDEYYRSHKLERSVGSGGEIRMDTSPLVPEEESFHGEMIGPNFGRDAIVLSVSLENSVTAVRGSVSIRVGSRVWPLQRRTIVFEAGNSTPVNIVTEVTGGDAAIEILDAMSEPTDIVISAVASGISPEVVDESPLRFETRTTQLPSAANKFKACVEGTQRQANPVLP